MLEILILRYGKFQSQSWFFIFNFQNLTLSILGTSTKVICLQQRSIGKTGSILFIYFFYLLVIEIFVINIRNEEYTNLAHYPNAGIVIRWYFSIFPLLHVTSLETNCILIGTIDNRISEFCIFRKREPHQNQMSRWWKRLSQLRPPEKLLLVHVSMHNNFYSLPFQKLTRFSNISFVIIFY